MKKMNNNKKIKAYEAYGLAGVNVKFTIEDLFRLNKILDNIEKMLPSAQQEKETLTSVRALFKNIVDSLPMDEGPSLFEEPEK